METVTPSTSLVVQTAVANGTSPRTSLGGDAEGMTDAEYAVLYRGLWRTCLGTVLPIMLVLGILGNAINLYVLSQPQFRAAVTYIYLRWMTAADLGAMLLLWSVVLGYVGADMRSYSAAFYMSHLHLPLLNTALVASALLVLCITLERYIAVCWPHKSRHLVNERRAKTIVGVILAAVFLVFLPNAFASAPQPLPPRYGPGYAAMPVETVTNHVAYKVYTWAHVILFKLIPIVLVVGLNAVTYTRYRRHLKASAAVTKHKAGGSAKNEGRLMVILFLTATLYAVCLTPMAISFLLEAGPTPASLEGKYRHQVFVAAANLLEYANSAANFYVYSLASRDFRTQMGAIFRRQCGARLGLGVAGEGAGGTTTTTALDTPQAKRAARAQPTGGGGTDSARPSVQSGAARGSIPMESGVHPAAVRPVHGIKMASGALDATRSGALDDAQMRPDVPDGAAIPPGGTCGSGKADPDGSPGMGNGSVSSAPNGSTVRDAADGFDPDVLKDVADFAGAEEALQPLVARTGDLGAGTGRNSSESNGEGTEGTAEELESLL